MRADGIDAVADELRHVDDLAGFAAFRDDAAGMAKPGTDEMMVQARAGQQGGDGRLVRRHGRIAHPQDGGPLGDGSLGVREQAIEGRAQGFPVAVGRESGVKGDGPDGGTPRGPDPAHVVRGEEGMGQAQDSAAFGARFQDVARTSGMAHERHG